MDLRGAGFSGSQHQFSEQSQQPQPQQLQQQQPRKENPFEMLRAQGNPTPDIMLNQRTNPIIGDPTYHPGPVNVSQTPNLYAGGLNNRYNSQSVTNMQGPEWKKDYLFIKSKNGPHSNPINIITNEYKIKH